MSLHNLSLEELSQKIKKREVSAKEVCRHFLDRVEKLNPQLNALLAVNPRLLAEAEKVDQASARGDDLGSMQGIPVGLKDMFCTAGLETTAGSKILKGFKPPYDATVVSKLKKAGALVLGKLNQDEFAMGSSNENSAYGPVRNPWDSSAVPGGSSGGSAAAVAAGLTPLALGTDTGGSIRQPAHFCNLVGIKPTYGRISRYGVIAYASSLDQAGPMVRQVEDAALALEVLSGFDPMDSTSSRQQVPSFRKNLRAEVKGLRVGLPEEFSKAEGLDPEVAKAFQAAQEVLQKAGAQLVSVRLPLTRYAVPVYYLVATSEASSNLARYDGVKYGHRAHFESLANVDLNDFYRQSRTEGFGPEVKRRIVLGTYCLSSGYYDAYYKKASQVRRLLQRQFLEAFRECDVMLSPVATSPAFRMGDRIKDPLTMYLNDIFTVSTNLAGLPGLSVPCAFSSAGLPIGLQLQAPHFEEQRILNVALHLQEAFQMHKRRPHGFE